MSTEQNDIVNKNKDLLLENEVLYKMLSEAKEVIEAIKKGNIDAIILANNVCPTAVVDANNDQAYRMFIENMSEGVVTLHSDGLILYCNSSFSKMLHLPLEKVIGRNFRDFISTKYQEDFDMFFNEFPLNDSKMELAMLKPDSTRAHYIISLNRLQLPNYIALNLVFTDVTALKNAEEELLKVNAQLSMAVEERKHAEDKLIVLNYRLKENIKILEDTNIELENFTHTASHDFQDPIRKIIIYSSLLIRDYYEIMDTNGLKYIYGVENASKQLSNLIDDIQNYSRLSKNDDPFKQTNLQLVMEDVLYNLKTEISETRANIIIRKELPTIEANPGQMRQLFQNLVSNSLKFVNGVIAPEIIITYKFLKGKELEQYGNSRSSEMFLVITINDNGIGFNPEYKNRIFTIFQKLNDNSLFPGAGIGLSICKKIVDQHKGFISAFGKPNNGSVFTITLPVNQLIEFSKH